MKFQTRRLQYSKGHGKICRKVRSLPVPYQSKQLVMNSEPPTNRRQGIFYFLSHRSLWKPLLSKLVPTMSLSVGVIAFMFIFAYLPQLAVLVFVNGPLAAFTTILLTLSESSTLINILSRTFLLQDALVDTFDGVLVARRQTEVLAEGRQLKSGNFNDPIAKLGKLVKSPFEKFTPKALVRYVMYLPLNFIPVVGTVIFVGLQGKSRGRAVHTRVGHLHSNPEVPLTLPSISNLRSGRTRRGKTGSRRIRLLTQRKSLFFFNLI